MPRISGSSFDTNVGDMRVHFEKITLDITDNMAVAKDRGVPNGYVDGDVDATGEAELDAANLKLFIEAAKRSGSFQDLEAQDLIFYAKGGPNEELKVEAFGCKFSISSLLDIDSAGGSKHLTKIPFVVTDSDFVRINGVPYLSEERTANLIGN